MKAARNLVRKKENTLFFNGLSGKLADCSSKERENCELFLVEGDSAGGSAKEARDRMFQAILPLRGKILNVEKTTIKKALENQEIQSMIHAIGTGIFENFDYEKLRYQKIIIMSDADVDGAHISTLLLTFFFRFMPKLIQNGNVYFAKPPLFMVARGNEKVYLYDEKMSGEMNQVFNMLMGNDVIIRKNFIMEHAKYAQNIDIV